MHVKTPMIVGILLQFGISGCVQSDTSVTETTSVTAAGAAVEECEDAGKRAKVVVYPQSNSATVTCE